MIKAILTAALVAALSSSALAQGVPISGLPAVTAPSANDPTVIVHAGVTSQATLANIFGNAPAIVTPGVTVTGLTPSASVCTSASSVLTTSGCSGGGGGGTITGVTAGTNTSGGGTTGTVTINVINNPTFTGTLSDSNSTPIALTSTSANVITSATSGSVAAFTLNAAGGTTGDLLDLALGGSSEVFFTNAGGLQVQNLQMFATNGLQLLNSGANSITSNTTGAVTSFILNASNGTPPSGDLADFQLGGSTKASITNNGGATFAGTITNSSTSPLTFSATSGNTTISSAAAGASVGYTFNNSGSATTLVNFQSGGSNKFTVAGSGAVTMTGALSGATTGGFSSTISTSATGAAISLSGAGPVLAFTANTAAAGLIESATTGAHPAFQLISTNATPPTGDLVDFATTGPTVVAKVAEFGGFCPGNGTTNAAQTDCFYTGAGVPAFSAGNGSLYMDFSGVHGTNLCYWNTSGASTSGTTWTASTAC